MERLVLFLLICLYHLNSYAVYPNGENNDSIHDGPYIFYVNDTLKAKVIENNFYREYCIFPENFSAIKTAIHLSFNYQDLLNVYSYKADYSQNYNEVDSIIAISDVHGQYKKYIDILIANGVIDKNLNWKFGKGHLVYIGDAFDRGDMVTEVLWNLFTLEKQAAKSGGMVHVLLGNHENMVLSGDLRYLNEKYKKVEELTKTSYSDLYAENSLLGKWLRNQPVMISINDIIFAHAGISIDLVRMKLPVKQVNKLFSSKIIGKDITQYQNNQKVDFLAGSNGPLWYRGYFDDSTFNEIKLDSILGFYAVQHIVVGHTTLEGVKSFFYNKVIGIDAGIGSEQPGEVLIYKNGNFYTGTGKGVRIKL
jgi:hypothetical protein